MIFRRFSNCFLGIALGLLALVTSAQCDDKFSIPEETQSPNGRYGVTVPVFDQETFDQEAEPRNALVEASTRRVLAVIDATPGYDRSLNHRSEPVASWSHDSSVLLWAVYGKWFPFALVLVKVEDGQVQWQRNVLKLAQQAILARTREANPKLYAAAKKANAGNGSAYPEGFTVDVEVLEPIGFPIRVRSVLTSNPKGIEDHPILESHLAGTIDKDGKLTVEDFQLGQAPWHER